MSDDEKLERVRRLNDYLNRLNNLLNSVYDLNFSQFRLAGTNNWSGTVKSNQFDDEYHSAEAQLNMAGPEIEDAISTCQSQMYSLAWSIGDVGKKAEALALATF
ncbi:MAG: hypothetical protein LBI13_04310 [Streptococcaceae bacterium]|jgi:hypothetical protein|nr:hypothetical protein [Streptococcaceae bacterium]